MAMNEGKKRCTLITGATGGIGKAFAELLAAKGHEHLFLVARNGDELNRIVGVETARHQVSVHTLSLDLGRHDAGELIAGELTARGLCPEVIINNAGFGLAGRADSLPLEEQIAMIDVNIRALSDLTLRFLPGMVKRGKGGVINVSSVAAFMPGPYMASYYASKAYVLSFTQALAREVKGSGVTITALCPGPVSTGFQDRAALDTSRLVYRLSRPQSASEVAAAGWSGFCDGKTVVYPRASDMVMAWAGKLLPGAAMMPLIEIFQKPKADGK